MKKNEKKINPFIPKQKKNIYVLKYAYIYF